VKRRFFELRAIPIKGSAFLEIDYSFDEVEDPLAIDLEGVRWSWLFGCIYFPEN